MMNLGLTDQELNSTQLYTRNSEKDTIYKMATDKQYLISHNMLT